MYQLTTTLLVVVLLCSQFPARLLEVSSTPEKSLSTGTENKTSTNQEEKPNAKQPTFVFKAAPVEKEFYRDFAKSRQLFFDLGLMNKNDEERNIQHMIFRKNKALLEILKKIIRMQGKSVIISKKETLTYPILKLKCIDHLKILRLGYTCIDSNSIRPEEREFLKPDDIKDNRFTSIFVVMRNFKKYFMIVLDSMYDLELGIYKHFEHNDIGLELIEYKIVDSRFVGIYSYLPHSNTLRHHIRSGNMSYYEKLFVMKQLNEYAIEFFRKFEPRNNLMMLNLLAANVLVTEESFYKLRLIRMIRGSKAEQETAIAPEKMSIKNKINQRSTIVYLLGCTFYFIFFEEKSQNLPIDETPIMKEYNENLKLKNFPEVSTSIIELIRSMMNSNPIDRVSLEYSLSKIEEELQKALTIEYQFKLWKSQIKKEMEFEIRKEYVQHVEMKRKKYQMAKIKDQSKKDKNNDSAAINSKYENEIHKADSLRMRYLKWIGRAEQCDLESTEDQINILSDYGLIPINQNEIVSFASVSSDPHYREEAEKNAHGDHGEDHGDGHGDDHHEDLHEMRTEFILLIAFLLLLIGIVSTYFYMKDKEIVMYLKEDFPAKLILT